MYFCIMEHIEGLSITLFALIAVLMLRSHILLRVFIAATAISIELELSGGFEHDASLMLIRGSLIGAILLALAISFLPDRIKTISSYFIALVFVIPIGAKAYYQGFEVVWNIASVALVLLGSLIPLLTKWKSKFVHRYMKVDESSFESGIQLVLAGILVVFSLFLSGTFGLILLATGLFATSLAQSAYNYLQLAISMFALAWVLFAIYNFQLPSNLLLQGNFWLGILVGMGVIFISKSLLVGQVKYFNLSIFIPLLLVFILILPAFIHESFGGLNTLIGSILGTAVMISINTDEKVERIFSGTFIPLILIGCTFFTYQLFLPEALPVNSLVQNQGNQSKTAKPIDPMTLPAFIPNENHTGSWTSLAENSKLTFDLGPTSGRTAGAFKNFETTAQFNSEGKLTNLEVTIQSKSITTFNSMRDEEVLGTTFIQSEKFPVAKYKSNSIKQVGENYEIDGELSFVGKTVKSPLIIRFISELKSKDKTILIFAGNAEVNRTLHQMKSDPKIGDLVDVSFEVALEKK